MRGLECLMIQIYITFHLGKENPILRGEKSCRLLDETFSQTVQCQTGKLHREQLAQVISVCKETALERRIDFS